MPGARIWFGHCHGLLGVAPRKKCCVCVRFVLELSYVEVRSRSQVVFGSDGSGQCGWKSQKPELVCGPGDRPSKNWLLIFLLLPGEGKKVYLPLFSLSYSAWDESLNSCDSLGAFLMEWGRVSQDLIFKDDLSTRLKTLFLTSLIKH